MRCGTTRKEFEAYRSGTLSRSEQSAMATHLNSCETCRGLFDEWERVAALPLGAEVPPVPENLAEKVLARVPSTHFENGTAAKTRPRYGITFSRAFRCALAAEVLLIVALHQIVIKPMRDSAMRLDLPVVATVTAADGTVNVLRKGEWKALKKGDELRAYSRVHSDESGTASLTLADGSGLDISPDTTVTLFGRTNEARTYLTLNDGEGRFSVPKKPGKFAVGVPAVHRRITVLGTEFILKLEREESGATRRDETGNIVIATLHVSVLSGKVLAESTWQDESFTLAEGETKALVTHMDRELMEELVKAAAKSKAGEGHDESKTKPAVATTEKKGTEEGDTRFIFKNVMGDIKNSTEMRAVIEVHKLVNGKWLSHSFVVKQEDRIGSVVWIADLAAEHDFATRYTLVEINARLMNVADADGLRKVKIYHALVRADDGELKRFEMESRRRFTDLWEKKAKEFLKTEKISFRDDDCALSKILEWLSDPPNTDFALKLATDLKKGDDPSIAVHVRNMTWGCALNWIARLSGTEWGLKNRAVHFGRDLEGVVRLPAELDTKRNRQCMDLLDSHRITFSFEDKRLSKILPVLADQTGIDFVNLLGEKRDASLTFAVNTLELRKALDWIATLTKTRWGLKNEAVYFEEADGERLSKAAKTETGEEDVADAWERDTLMFLESRKEGCVFQDTPLSTVVNYLGERTGLDITLTDEEDGDKPVRLRVDTMTLRCALNWIATLTGLQWGLNIEDEKICFARSVEGLVVPKYLHAWDQERRKKYAEALDTRKISFFFQETQLSKVLSFFTDLTGMDFVPVLEKENDPPVTLRVNRMALRNSLDWIATLTGTKWGLRDEAICFHDKDLTPTPTTKWEADLDKMLDARINVDFRNELLDSAFAFLSRESGVKFLDKIPEGAPRITMRCGDVTLREILNALAGMLGDWRKRENGIEFGLAGRWRPETPTWRRTMMKTLDEKRVSVDFRDILFTRALLSLADKTGLDFIPQLNEGTDHRITFSAKDMTVRSILNSLEALSGLTWTLDRQAVSFGGQVPTRSSYPIVSISIPHTTVEEGGRLRVYTEGQPLPGGQVITKIEKQRVTITQEFKAGTLSFWANIYLKPDKGWAGYVQQPPGIPSSKIAPIPKCRLISIDLPHATIKHQGQKTVYSEGESLADGWVITGIDSEQVTITRNRALTGSYSGTTAIVLKAKSRSSSKFPPEPECRLISVDLPLATIEHLGHEGTYAEGDTLPDGYVLTRIEEENVTVTTTTTLKDGSTLSKSTNLRLKDSPPYTRTEVVVQEFPKPDNKGFLGVSMKDIEKAQIELLNLENTDGALVVQVVKGSPAEKAGIEKNDVVLEFDGKEIKNTAQLWGIIKATPPGTTVAIGVMREGIMIILNVALTTKKESAEQSEE